jgi:hypothetical protein
MRLQKVLRDEGTCAPLGKGRRRCPRLVDPHQAAAAGRARDLAMFNLAIDEQARQVAA